jgi:site-specific DNA-cytosine methylase
MKIRSGCDVDANGKAAGKGALIQTDKSGTLSCVQDQYLFQPVYSVENHPADSRVDIDDSGKVQTLTSRMGTGGGNVPMVMEPAVFSKSKRAQNTTDYETWQESDTANTLNAFDTGDVRTNECVIALDRASYNQGKNAQYDFDINDGGVASTIVAKGPSAVCYTVDQGGGKSACNVQEGQAPTLTCTHGGEPAVCYSLDPLSSNSMKSSNPHSGCHETDVARTIDTTYPDPSKNQGGVAVVEQVHIIGNGQADQTYLQERAGALNCMHDQQAVMIASSGCRTRYTVRRLTPLECERLQGYPDGWTDIGEYIDSNGKKKKSSDAARYKALGNSIAIPPWKWVMKRLCACYERDATLASLFDGIGGFPYIWEQINGKGSCLWASEIEEFPMAVTKVRIGE